MKRPLALVGFTYLLTLAVAVYFGAQVSLILACVCLAGFLATTLKKKTRVTGVFSLVFLAAALAFGYFSGSSAAVTDMTARLDGKDAVIDGVICELPYRAYSRNYYEVEIRSVSGAKEQISMKIRLSSQNALRAEPYSHIRGKVHLFLPSGGEGYTSRSYYASKGITMFGYLYEYEAVQVTPPTEKPPYYYALCLRSDLLKSVRTMLPRQEADLVNGVLFGDQTSLSAQVSSDFRAIGISHILSVSGLHMATMAELLLMLFLFLKLPRKLAAAFASGGVVVFMAITCFVPSVTRSGVMCLLYLSGMLFSRKQDALTSLGAAVLLIGLSNPFAAADIGLLLSFSATLGLVLCSGKITCFLDEKYDKIKALQPLVHGFNGVVATTVGATLFTLPIVILSFRSVTLISLFSNLLELVPSTLMMNFAAVASVLNLIAPQSYFAMPFALISGLLAKYMQLSSHWLAQIPYASVSASYGFVLIWLSGSILLFAIAYLIRRSNRLLQASAWLSAILLLTGILSYQVSVRDVTRLAILDIGNAQSVVLTRNDHAAVIGCGGFSSNPIGSYLRSQGITKLDYIQPLTQEKEESKNCAELTQAFRPEHLVMQESDYLDDFLRKEISKIKTVSSFQEQTETKLWNHAELLTVSSGQVSAVRITVNQITVLVCPEGVDYTALPSDWLSSDFLITGTVPDRTTPLEPFYTVLTADEEGLQKNYMQARSLHPLVTGGQGNILLELKGDRTLEVRRE